MLMGDSQEEMVTLQTNATLGSLLAGRPALALRVVALRSLCAACYFESVVVVGAMRGITSHF